MAGSDNAPSLLHSKHVSCTWASACLLRQLKEECQELHMLCHYLHIPNRYAAWRQDARISLLAQTLTSQALTLGMACTGCKREELRPTQQGL